MLPFSNAFLSLFNTSADVDPDSLYIANNPFKDCSFDKELGTEDELRHAIVETLLQRRKHFSFFYYATQ